MSLCWTFTAKILTPIYTLGTLAKNINIQKSYKFSFIRCLARIVFMVQRQPFNFFTQKEQSLNQFHKAQN